jgi:hypothetical protein
MKKKLEIPRSVIDTFNAIFDNWDECSKYSSADSERRDSILQNLKRMMNPTEEETNLIDKLTVANVTAEAMREALEKKEPVLIEKFRHEFSKWLRGKYLYNRRHHYYIRILSVKLDDTLHIEGPTIIEEHEAKDITRFDNRDSEFNILPLKQVSRWNHQHEFEQVMAQFEECELSDITDAVENNKTAWVERYDNMKASIDDFANIELPKDKQ